MDNKSFILNITSENIEYIEEILNNPKKYWVNALKETKKGDFVFYRYSTGSKAIINEMKKTNLNKQNDINVKLAEERYEEFGGIIFAIGVISQNAEFKENGYYAEITNIYILENPYKVNEDKDKIKINRFGGITALSETQKDSLLKNINKDNNILDIFWGTNDILQEINIARVKNKNEWIEILKYLEKEDKNKIKCIDIFKYMLKLDSYTVRCSQMAKKLGINVGTLNLTIGKQFKKVVNFFDLKEQQRKFSDKHRYWNIPFKENENYNDFTWQLREELVEALVEYYNLEKEYKFVKKEIKIKEVHNTDFNFIKGHTQIKRDLLKGKLELSELEKINKIKKEIGNKGEEAVVKFEKQKLKKCGLYEKAKEVRIVDSDSYGYDVISFDELGNEIHIEVKTYSGNGKRMQFYISENELETFEKNENCYIYYICNIKSNPQVYIISGNKKAELIKRKKEFIIPIQYKVDIEIEEN